MKGGFQLLVHSFDKPEGNMQYMCFVIHNNLSIAIQRSDVNYWPLSEVIDDGIPNLEIHPFISVMQDNGMDSGHRVKRSNIMNR